MEVAGHVLLGPLLIQIKQLAYATLANITLKPILVDWLAGLENKSILIQIDVSALPNTADILASADLALVGQFQTTESNVFALLPVPTMLKLMLAPAVLD